MTKTIGGYCKSIFSCWGTSHNLQAADVTEDIREEYANAFRTQSYFDFWSRVVEITNPEPIASVSTESPSSSGARLPSYRLFAEHLLDPDQATVTTLLNKTQFYNDTKLLLVDYFLETSNASLLCGHLLKDIDHIRAKHRAIKKAIEATLGVNGPQLSSPVRLIELCRPKSPIVPHSFASTRFQDVQSRCTELLKRLEVSRDRVSNRIRSMKRVQRGFATVLVALTVSFTIVVVTHGLFVFVAFPGVVVGSIGIRSTKEVAKAYAQLDVASKGAYILTRDLDTISRMVARVKDDMEHIRAKIGLVAVLSVEDRLQGNEEVIRQLKMNEVGFREQLDELEEHLYLCFITINRARNLVLQEISDLKPTSPAK